ncbi:MAG: VWA domain-containing protein [Crocinitomicaceae bacterium]|nr:VWA domain-containing protein [Crocinitomicaceae bacterium]
MKHDFGELESYSIRYVDIVLSNKGNKQEWLLSVKKPFEVVYINSNQFIEKDSSIIVRLQVNPKTKGRFSYEVQVFTSDRDEAVKVKLTGSLANIDQNGNNSMTSCPSFSERPGGKNPNKFDLTVVTIDKKTKEELSQSTVSMLQNGRPIWTKRTNKKGLIKEDATLGLSYFYATHEGYYSAELGAYINFKRNYVVLELDRDERIIIPDPIPTPIDDTLIVMIEIDPVPEIEIIDHIEVDTTVLAEAPPSFGDIPRDDFTEEHFNPINVVFILDVSSSMKSADKMELMKYSLYQLSGMLRLQDKMGIVTYSSNAKVLLKPTSGANKDEINEQVEGLKASGYTAGGKGIKLGYKQALAGKISNGVNHVIIITDGAFNRDSDDYKRVVRKYKRKGIKMSVVGIKNKVRYEEEMRNAAKVGGGRYIPVFGLADAQNNLTQEIRLLTYKH